MAKPAKLINPLSALPSVDAVLGTNLVQPYLERLNGEFVTYCVRQSLAMLRGQIQKEKDEFREIGRKELLKSAAEMTAKKIESILSETEKIVGTSVFFGSIWMAMLRT